MPQIKENFFENVLFKFINYSCDCVIDIEHIAPKVKPISKFKVQEILEKPITFGYAAKDGLVRIASNGTIEDKNILGTLISLPDKSTKELVSFFNKNGFLFPTSVGTYETFDESSLYDIINRLKMTVELMTATNEIKKNYKNICDLTISILFSKDIIFKTSAMKSPYTGCHHTYIDKIKNPPTKLSELREQESFEGDVYHVNDTIYGSTELNIGDYNDIIGGYVSITNYPNISYSGIASLYLNYEVQDMNKKISDFLFHFFHDMSGDSSAEFSTEMKSGLIEIAKYIIGEEINANLNGIRPVYDFKTMSPSWEVDSLLCALYFSIFYLKPDLELYRQCANPRCKKYFLVRTTSTRTKYCSTECCNRVTQDRYRKKRREKRE